MTKRAIPPDELSPETLQKLATAWLIEFQAVARQRDLSMLNRLFHSQAVLWGIEKGGCCDWPIRLQFTFDLDNARMTPISPFIMVLCDWTTRPLVIGGDVKRGHATFLIVVEPKQGENKGYVECAHAHFSAAVNP